MIVDRVSEMAGSVNELTSDAAERPGARPSGRRRRPASVLLLVAASALNLAWWPFDDDPDAHHIKVYVADDGYVTDRMEDHLIPHWQTEDGTTLYDTDKANPLPPLPPMRYESSNPSVLQVSNTRNSSSGTFRCLRDGDARVSIVALGGSSGYSETVTLRCRLVARLEMPASLRFVIGEPSKSFRPRPIGEAGTFLSEVPVDCEFTSMNALDVVRWDKETPRSDPERAYIAPVAEGRAGVKCKAGRGFGDGASATLTVLVGPRE